MVKPVALNLTFKNATTTAIIAAAYTSMINTSIRPITPSRPTASRAARKLVLPLTAPFFSNEKRQIITKRYV